MPKYDAFGREIGEDSLEEVGWTTGSVETQPTAQIAPPQMITAKRRSGAGRGVFVLLAVVGLLAGAGFFVASVAQDIAEDVTLPEIPTIPEVPTPQGVPVPEVVPEEEPSASEEGEGGGSLLRARNLGSAIDKLRGRGRIVHMRLAADRIDAQLLSDEGRLRSIQIDSNLRTTRQLETGGGFSHLETIAFGSIDTAAPSRLIADVRRRIGRKPAVNYLVVSDFAGEIHWNVYLHDGKIFQGDERGRLVRQIS